MLIYKIMPLYISVKSRREINKKKKNLVLRLINRKIMKLTTRLNKLSTAE